MKKNGRTNSDSNSSERRIEPGESAIESGNDAGTSVGESEPIRDELASILGTDGKLQHEFNTDRIADTGNLGTTEQDSGASTDSSGGDSGGAIRRGRGRPRGSKSAGGNRSRGSDRGRNSGPDSTENLNDETNVEPSPEHVDFDNLLKFPKKAGRPGRSTPQTELAKFLSTVYRFPYHMGMGSHWPLDTEEARDFAGAILDAKANLTKAQQAWVEKFLKEWAPLLALGGIFYAINVPRVLESKRQYELRRMAQQKTGPRAVDNIPRATQQAQDFGVEDSSESTKTTEFTRNLKNSFASRATGNVE